MRRSHLLLAAVVAAALCARLLVAIGLANDDSDDGRLYTRLAHNVLVWARHWLAPHEPQLRRYGRKRLVRDVFHSSGFLAYDARGRVTPIVFNRHAPLARGLARSFDVLLRPAHLAVNWGQT